MNRRRLLAAAAALAAGAACARPGPSVLLGSAASAGGDGGAAGRAPIPPDRARLDALADAARRTERLRAIVVTVDGEVALAEAFRGPPVDRAVNVKSVSKSVVAALAGTAIGRGEVPGVDATLGEVAPGLVPPGADPRVAALTIEDLLTMRTGLERQSGAAYGQWASSDDWVAHALTRPFVAEPGGRFLYSTATWHVLGAALAEATGKSLLELARERLGAPLGIDLPAWTRDPQGRYLGGNEMAMTPLAMARFGELYRRGGRWGGARVLEEAWTRESLVARTVSPWSGDAYGYGWFLRELGGEPAAYARGYGGQLVHVVPGAAAVVAITSDVSRAARGDGYVEALHAMVGRCVGRG